MKGDRVNISSFCMRMHEISFGIVWELRNWVRNQNIPMFIPCF